MNNIKNFFLKLLSSKNETSSKRFSALITLLCLLLLTIIAALKNGGICPEYMYDGLLMMVAGLFGFNMAENIFGKKDKLTTETPVEETPSEDYPPIIDDDENEEPPLHPNELIKG